MLAPSPRLIRAAATLYTLTGDDRIVEIINPPRGNAGYIRLAAMERGIDSSSPFLSPHEKSRAKALKFLILARIRMPWLSAEYLDCVEEITDKVSGVATSNHAAKMGALFAELGA